MVFALAGDSTMTRFLAISGSSRPRLYVLRRFASARLRLPPDSGWEEDLAHAPSPSPILDRFGANPQIKGARQPSDAGFELEPAEVGQKLRERASRALL